MKKYRVRPGSVADKVVRHIIPITASAVIAVGAMGTMQVMYRCSTVEAMETPVLAQAVEQQVAAAAPKHYNIPLSIELQDHITARCAGTGIAPTLVFAMIAVESDYKTDAIGDKGRSKGLMQIQQRWHQDSMNAVGATDLLNPYDNTATGICILTNLLDRGNGECWALTAYNAGPSAATRYMRKGITSKYFTKVKIKQAEIERLVINESIS